MAVSHRTACTGWAVLATLALGCAAHPPPPIGATAVPIAAGQLPRGPTEPQRGLPMPSLDVAWTPPMLTAGHLEGLRARLQERGAVALHLGERLGGPGGQDRAAALVQALGAEMAQGRALPESPFAGVSLPLERVPDEGGGPPRYRWAAGPLPRVPDASATLVVDDAQVEPGQWRALPAHAVGSCEEPMAALAVGQEQSLAELEPFLDHADAVLWQVYRAALQASLPRLTAELEPYAAPRSRGELADADAWEQYRCGHAYWEYLQPFVRCEAEALSCASAPRLYLIGGARIGTAEPSVYIPEGCAERVGHDYVAELRTNAIEAAQVARDHLAPSWSTLADRLGAVTEVYEALADVCVPRRRRFSEDDLEVARERLAAIGDALASDELDHPHGQWSLVEEPFHVPGVGPVQQVAYYDAGPGSPSETAVAEARGLRELLLRRALCRSAQPALPLATALVEGRSGEVEFFGYFFEEELFCGELPPLLPGVETPPAEGTPPVGDAPPPVADAPPPAG